MQRSRLAIGAMVGAATDAFRRHEADFVAGTVAVPLLEKSAAETPSEDAQEFFVHACI